MFTCWNFNPWQAKQYDCTWCKSIYFLYLCISWWRKFTNFIFLAQTCICAHIALHLLSGNLWSQNLMINAFSCRIYTPFHEQKGISNAERVGHALLNAIIVIAVVLVMTILLVILYLKKCYKVSCYVVFYFICCLLWEVFNLNRTLGDSKGEWPCCFILGPQYLHSLKLLSLKFAFVPEWILPDFIL